MSEHHEDAMPAGRLACYKCHGNTKLMVEEKRHRESGKLIYKKFICVECAEKFKNESKA